jgi:alkylated DNA repair dioxygenase AlkB
VQLPLFAQPFGQAAFDPEFRRVERTQLGLGAWIDRAPKWIEHDAALFSELERELEWRSEKRAMYTRIVDVPRLLASVPKRGLVEAMRAALSQRYGEDFVHVTAALYRDGRDSVAFHGDTTARDMNEAIVATVSLGGARTFLVKPIAASPGERSGAKPGKNLSRAFALGGGDLVVMGGTCQRTHRHAIPKAARAEPRIALIFRPSWATGYKAP